MIYIDAKDAAEILSDLKLRLRSILNLFDPQSRIFYIDYPVHTNIGDLLINVGTEQFFIDYKVPIYERYSILNVPDASSLKVTENTTFLCHGGGNFGDLYPEHQGIREWVVDNFPHARIIFLPQSLHYSSQEAQRVSLEKIARHSNCHVLARDQESLDALHQSGITQSSLMPDMAHQLWGTLSPATSFGHAGDIYFLRQDQEATPVPVELADIFARGSSVDWRDIVTVPHRVFTRVIHHILKFCGTFFPEKLSVLVWYSARDIMIHDAVKYFSKREHVYTNRLHAMLLALLLGRDVVAFDNTYAKLSRYVNTWLNVAVQDKTL